MNEIKISQLAEQKATNPAVKAFAHKMVKEHTALDASMKPFVEQMMNNRISVRVVPGRTRSWDHRKLGMQGMPISGSTAQYL